MTSPSISKIPGGFIVPNDTHIRKWQKECGRLDHDKYWLQVCLQHIPEGAGVIDAGAFDGDHTISYSKKAGAGGMVLAIEPGSVAFECLKHNVEVQSMREGYGSPVAAIQTAIGKTFSMVSHVESENLGASHVVPSGHIPCAPLDSFIPIFSDRKLNFIKLDIEGWETDALLGATEIIRKHRPVLGIEVNAGALERAGSSRAKLFDLLGDLRYTMKKYPDTEPWDAPQYDIICKP